MTCTQMRMCVCFVACVFLPLPACVCVCVWRACACARVRVQARCVPGLHPEVTRDMRPSRSPHRPRRRNSRCGTRSISVVHILPGYVRHSHDAEWAGIITGSVVGMATATLDPQQRWGVRPRWKTVVRARLFRRGPQHPAAARAELQCGGTPPAELQCRSAVGSLPGPRPPFPPRFRPRRDGKWRAGPHCR